ncbi:hypothetical protein BCR33DRAFT_762428 [Rhizoclosmatium globosum]|uniref:Uncharacterized protein n=1 Tax=Rhizoclosmatium globosum TaxID=329046 RepID=A0A1Y2CWW0_9FUNG|nr:hypothetical protein BCR33DRAFT_762428 [Rhizoclosmatium globosum]|eukprot:ORY50825.1 hypothetical protein BCR33DRAFT_762428 [Rhizoclosmatium globosum]
MLVSMMDMEAELAVKLAVVDITEVAKKFTESILEHMKWYGINVETKCTYPPKRGSNLKNCRNAPTCAKLDTASKSVKNTINHIDTITEKLKFMTKQVLDLLFMEECVILTLAQKLCLLWDEYIVTHGRATQALVLLASTITVLALWLWIQAGPLPSPFHPEKQSFIILKSGGLKPVDGEAADHLASTSKESKTNAGPISDASKGFMSHSMDPFHIDAIAQPNLSK